MSDNWWQDAPVATKDQGGEWWHAAPVADAPEQPSLSAGETAVDAAKSLGIGAARGIVGLSTLPGNIEQLGRLGINKGAELLGAKPPVSDATVLPTTNDVIAKDEAQTGKKWYQPQSTLGKYAQAAGEFAPLALGGEAGLAGRAANVLGPAVASETAGELTQGTPYEGVARFAGGVAGGALPSLSMRAITPNPATGERAAAIANLKQNGVTDLTAGQMTGKTPLRVAESVAEHTPFGGNIPGKMATAQNEQFTQAALKMAGINAKRATSDVIDQGFTDLGAKFDALAARNGLRLDQPLLKDLTDAQSGYNRLVPESQRAPIVDDIIKDISNMPQGRQLAGESYQSVRSIVDRSARATKQSNPQLSSALSDIREALDDAMGRSAKPGDAAAWKEVRGQYRNLLAVEKASTAGGENAALGLISPAALKNAVKSQGARAYARGQREIGELAKSGEAILKPLPNSGTAPRMQALNAMRDLGLAGGAAATGGATGIGMLPALGALAAPALASRALMSGPAQKLLTNQMLAGQIHGYNAMRPGIGARAAVSSGNAFAGRLRSDDTKRR